MAMHGVDNYAWGGWRFAFKERHRNELREVRGLSEFSIRSIEAAIETYRIRWALGDGLSRTACRGKLAKLRAQSVQLEESLAELRRCLRQVESRADAVSCHLVELSDDVRDALADVSIMNGISAQPALNGVMDPAGEMLAALRQFERLLLVAMRDLGGRAAGHPEGNLHDHVLLAIARAAETTGNEVSRPYLKKVVELVWEAAADLPRQGSAYLAGRAQALLRKHHEGPDTAVTP